jgi:hypothetical protein
MTSTEMTTATDAGSLGLSEQMRYAQTVSTGALLPQAYRGRPADILIAIGLGQAMGLSPAESLYRIDVIQGKPTASAELIAANVRKAGHKLRVRGDETSCTATIVRADDPDFPFEVTRDIAWVKRMQLDKKDNYLKQPGTMLQWRAVAAVARLACPEALYGVAYTPDELDDTSSRGQSPVVSVASFAPAVAPEPAPEAEPETGEAITPAQSKALHAAFNRAGYSRDERDARLSYVSDVVQREVTTSNDLTRDEASRVLARLDSDYDIGGQQ